MTTLIDNYRPDSGEGISRIGEVLRFVTSRFNFDSFSHYFRSSNAVETNLYTLSRYYMDLFHGGDCLDFAVVTNGLLNESGVATSFIGTEPNPRKYSTNQIDFIKWGHVALLYESLNGNFLIEPALRLNTPIPIFIGSITESEEEIFEIVDVSENSFILVVTNKAKNKRSNPRIFNTTPIDPSNLTMFSERFKQIPKNLQLVNAVSHGTQEYYIQFLPDDNVFIANIPGIPERLLPNELRQYDMQNLNQIFRLSDCYSYLRNFLEIYQQLPPTYWIR